MTFESDREAATGAAFETNLNTVIIPSTFEPGFTQPFTLIIYSKEPLTIINLRNNETAKEVPMPRFHSGIDADDNIDASGAEKEMENTNTDKFDTSGEAVVK